MWESSPGDVNSPASAARRQVRGAGAFDLLQALNTGHAGSLSTIHANSAAQSLCRFTNCVLQANVVQPYPARQYSVNGERRARARGFRFCGLASEWVAGEAADAG